MIEVLGTDDVCRYDVDRKNYYRPSDKSAKPKAFMPHNGQVSVFIVTDKTEQQRWEIGERYVADPRNKRLKARIEIDAQAVFDVGLDIEPDDEPPGHANIIGWWEDIDKVRMVATRLAAKARVTIKTDD